MVLIIVSFGNQFFNLRTHKIFFKVRENYQNVSLRIPYKKHDVHPMNVQRTDTKLESCDAGTSITIQGYV